jgi:hypothetical protein
MDDMVYGEIYSGRFFEQCLTYFFGEFQFEPASTSGTQA